MRRFLRYLRIAFSATCPIACVLLILLWVRSYRGCDVVYWAPSTRLTMSSASGVIGVSVTNTGATPKWAWNTIEIMPGPVPSWYFKSDHNGTHLRFPHRLPIVVFAVMGVVASRPWLRKLKWQFSLRTLLIATTLIAVVLGLSVWLR
jgi:hypothetical protein